MLEKLNGSIKSNTTEELIKPNFFTYRESNENFKE